MTNPPLARSRAKAPPGLRRAFFAAPCGNVSIDVFGSVDTDRVIVNFVGG
jgi:hypothetical protein